jgi:hypothetical protein
VRAQITANGDRITLPDPTRGAPVDLVFDHVHDGVETTEGGRQVVCVDFRASDGTLYDVDYYVARPPAGGDILVQDTVVHKVAGKAALSDEERARLNRQAP